MRFADKVVLTSRCAIEAMRQTGGGVIRHVASAPTHDVSSSGSCVTLM